MKRILAFLLAVAMLLSMVACGAKEDKDETTSATANGAAQGANDQPSDAASEQDTVLDTAMPDSEVSEVTEIASEEAETSVSESEAESETVIEDEPEIESETTASDEDRSVSNILEGIFGDHNGNAYQNTFLGIACELGSEWSVFDEAQIASLMGIATDLISDEEISKAVEQSASATVFMATRSDGSTIGITVENAATYGSGLTESTFVDAAVPILESALATAGYENLQISSMKVDFAGVERTAILIEAEFYGFHVYEMMVPMIYEGCIAAVTVATMNENQCLDLLEVFSALPM